MKYQGMVKLFVDELSDMYNAENQILEYLPKLMKFVSLPELKDALNKHLNETQQQIKRIEKIFNALSLNRQEETCEGIKGIIEEAEELTREGTKSPTLDAAIISAAQKIEHYEIASYGTLRSFAKHLGFDKQIIDWLQESLDEEGAANKKLTKIAEGSFFSSGVNKEAVKAGV